jgi:hypothetical protein
VSGLVMLVPSRARPRNAAFLAAAWKSTVTGDSRLVFLVDGDDPARDEYLAGQRRWGCEAIGVRVLDGPHGTGIGAILNEHAPLEAATAAFTGFMGDDHRPRTKGWDEALTGALERPGVAYGDDLLQRQNLPTAMVMSSGIITTLGYMIPPGVRHLYIDNFWMRIGEDLGNLQYLPGVVIEHMHAVAGKASWDEGYIASTAPARFTEDLAAYEAFLAGRWPGDLERLRAGMVPA